MPRQNSKPLGVLSAIAGLLSFSALAGVLAAALVAPTLAVASTTASSSIGIFEALPDYMTIDQQSQKNVLWAQRKKTWVPFAEIFKQNREEVSWDQVSPLIKDALVSGEDRRFYEHGGVDLRSIARAATGYLSTSEIVSGASTLSMQLVKNLLIMQATQETDEDERERLMDQAQAQTLDRKLKEAKLAIGLEKRYTKNQILLAYLNITGFGGQTYGIEAAARQYLSKSALDVTPAEAASLVAIVQDPNNRNLKDPENFPANQERRDSILSDMLELGKITQAQYDEAVATPVEDYVEITDPTNGCSYASTAKTFCDYIQKKVKDLEVLGENPAERQANWDRGGYNVYTTIDLDQQENAQKQLAAQTPANETRFDLGSAVSSVQVGTGRILIMAQNKGFDDTGEGDALRTTAVNFNTDKDYGGSSGFPAASTYKIFTTADWLINGHGLNEIVNGSKHDSRLFRADCVGGYVFNPPYSPRNDDSQTPGPVNIPTAMALSINAAFISMAEQLDLCEIADTAKAMGVHRADGDPLKTDPSSVLGVNEVAPLSMASAVATVSNGGVYCQPIAIDRIVGPDGVDLGGEPKSCAQAITPEVAAGVAYAMAAVMNGGLGGASNPRDGVPLIGKTGTDDESSHTWIVGGSTKTALAVWVGNIVNKQALRNIGLPGGNGATARHRIAQPIFAALNAEYGGGSFPSPPSNLLSGTTLEIPSLTGRSPEEAKALLESLGLSYAAGGKKPSDAPIGTVARTNPTTGTKVSKGYQVVVFTSDGTLYVEMPDLITSPHDPAAARDALVALGFDPGNISYSWIMTTNGSELCRVIATTPSPGAGTSKQAAVTLTVGSNADGTPPPGCSVP